LSESANKTQPPQAAIDQVISLYNQDQLEQTVSLAENLVGQYPNALILYDILGAAYMDLKNAEKTLESYKKALQLNSNHTDAYNNMGMAFYDQGRFNEAVECYQKAVKLEPNFADVRYNLGNALKQAGNLKQAIESYKASLVINPNDAEVLFNYGNALKSYGDFDQAIEVYAKVLKINPNFIAAQTNMDNTVEEKAELDKDVADYAKIVKLEIDSAEIVSFSAVLLMAKGHLDAAIDICKQTIKKEPGCAQAYFILGNILKEKGDLDASIDFYKQALKIKPDYAAAYNNMGVALKNRDELDAAIESYNRAIEIKPDYAEAYWNQSLAFLFKGDFKNGWAQYDWRWRSPNFNSVPLQSTKSEWEPSQKGRILLWGEQGLGDQIMYASLIPDLIPLCSELLVQVDSRLVKLFERSFSGKVTIYPNAKKISERQYDSHISMGSLPKYLRNDLESFKKSSQGYLFADRKRAKLLRDSLLSDGTEFLYGIAWRGGKEEILDNKQRFIALNKIAPVIKKENVKLVSLQYGEIETELADLKKSLGIDIATVAEIDNFKDVDGLAALIEACDVVVSVASSTANLSGALYKKTAVLLPHIHDWRWKLVPPECYWYSSVRLFKQEQDSSWDQSIAELLSFVEKR
jgi:tetratricopeptide (TPR) repeat protein